MKIKMAEDEFKDAPLTMGELRSEKTQDGSNWKPRDLLIKMLRDIDNGLEVNTVVCFYTKIVEGQERIGFYQASPDIFKAFAVVHLCNNKMIQECMD